MRDFVELSGEQVELPGAMQIDDGTPVSGGVTDLHMIPPAKEGDFAKPMPCTTRLQSQTIVVGLNRR